MSLKPPKDLRERLAAAATQHGYDSPGALFETLLRRGLAPHEQPGDPPALDARLTAVAARRGYASRDELVEHLVEQGLRPLESAADTGEVAARLKGLGYIE
ncbi:MAG TPA: hypothetical protein VGQ83_13490 [Polyangia bacterium]|jgi:hypothetical protein